MGVQDHDPPKRLSLGPGHRRGSLDAGVEFLDRNPKLHV